jgi:hypothetical protein
VLEKGYLSLADGSEADLDLSFGVGRGALWFAGGSFDSVQRLNAAFERMDAAQPEAAASHSVPPLLITASAGPWQQLPLGEDFEARLQRSLAEDAFFDADKLRVELQPTRHGLRFDARIETGFLRWVALLLASQHDASQL